MQTKVFRLFPPLALALLLTARPWRALARCGGAVSCLRTSPDQATGAVLGLGAVALAGWLTLAVAAALVARLPGRLGRASGRVAAVLTPRLLRALLCGSVAGSAALVPAGLAAAAPGPALPSLDWPGLAAPVAQLVPAPAGPAPAPGLGPTPARGDYLVAPGDSLWRIAAHHLPAGADAADVARSWPRWYAANRQVIGPDPALLRPGERLQPPG